MRKRVTSVKNEMREREDRGEKGREGERKPVARMDDKTGALPYLPQTTREERERNPGCRIN